MRKLIIAIVILLVLMVGGVLLAIKNVNGLLEENRDSLAELVSDTLGRRVQFEKAEVAFPGRLAIKVEGLRIAEDPRFGKSEFLSLDAAYVDVQIWPALLRRLEVDGIRLDHPTIHVIQTSRGFNFSTLGQSENAEAAPGLADSGEAPPMALAIAGFKIIGGTVLYEDRTANPPTAITFEEFESSGSDLSLEGPLDIEFSGLARPTGGNAAVASRFKGEVKIESLATGAGRLHLESPKFHPLLLGLNFDEGGPTERLDSLKIEVGLPANVQKSGYSIALVSSAGRIGGFDFSDLDTKILYRGSKLDIEHVTIGLLGGQAQVSGDMTFGPPGRSPFHLNTKLQNLDSNELAAIFLDLPRGFISGQVGGDIDLTGDSLEWESLKRSLGGNIALQVGEGALENINVLDRMVSLLIAAPGLGAVVAGTLRDVAPSALQGDRTPFKNLNLDFSIANGKLNAETLQLMAGDFLLSGLGSLGFDGSVTGDGTIRFSESLSKKILQKADRLAPLLGGGESVELPIHLGGSVSSPNFRPDISALAFTARTQVTEEITRTATKKLSEVIFGKRKAPTEPVDGEDSPAATTPRGEAEELIKEGLGKLFGR